MRILQSVTQYHMDDVGVAEFVCGTGFPPQLYLHANYALLPGRSHMIYNIFVHVYKQEAGTFR